MQIDDSQYQPLFYFDVEMDETLLKETAKKLLADERAGKVIRIKGFVKTSDSTQVEINATEIEYHIIFFKRTYNIIFTKIKFILLIFRYIHNFY